MWPPLQKKRQKTKKSVSPDLRGQGCDSPTNRELRSHHDHPWHQIHRAPRDLHGQGQWPLSLRHSPDGPQRAGSLALAPPKTGAQIWVKAASLEGGWLPWGSESLASRESPRWPLSRCRTLSVGVRVHDADAEETQEHSRHTHSSDHPTVGPRRSRQPPEAGAQGPKRQGGGHPCSQGFGSLWRSPTPPRRGWRGHR